MLNQNTTAKIFALLDKNCTIATSELAQLVGCHPNTASQTKGKYLKAHPEIKEKPNNKAKIFSLLDNNPAYTAKELAQITNCTISTAFVLKNQYFKNYPQIEKPPTGLEIGAKRKKVIFDLLDKNPTLSGQALANLVNCDRATANRFKRQYTGSQNKSKAERGKEIQKLIFTSLDKNPALSVSELAKLTNCSNGAAHNHKRAWLQQHGAGPQKDKEA